MVGLSYEGMTRRVRVRIAIIAPPWVPVPPPAYGGTEAVLDTLARGLQAAGHDVLLFATGDSTCEVPRGWVRESRGRHGRRPARRPSCTMSSTPTRPCSDWGADVVHDHTLVGPGVRRSDSAIPVVTTNHGPFDGELGDYYRAIAPTVPIIAISQHHAASAVDTRVAAVIHHGVDVDALPGRRRRRRLRPVPRPHEPRQGRAHGRRASPAPPGCRCGSPPRCGSRPSSAYFEPQVAPLLGDGIEYVGEVGGGDEARLLADAACLLNPMAWPEPFGMVMIEALACGTPVVATPLRVRCRS